LSTYAAYDRAAAHYDGTRWPVGIDVLIEHLSRRPIPLSELELLDAGCGTGVYSAMLVDKVRRVTAVDLSEGMLGIARAKFRDQERAGRIAVRRASIEQLPFADGSFDVVMFNQVLHHLEDGGDSTYGGHARALAEAFRVLRPGGLVWINACGHEQLRRGFWFYDLVPEALEGILARCAPAERIESILADCGFHLTDLIVPAEVVLQGQAYFDPRGPLKEDWRSGDSFWALATPAQLRRVEAQLTRLEVAGHLTAFVEERDRGRSGCGQVSYFLARRPGR